MKNNYSRFYAIIKQINQSGGDITKEGIVSDFTSGRTKSLGDLSLGEFQELERSLVKLAPTNRNAADYQFEKLDRSRKAIISQFRSIGRTANDAIEWSEKYGVNGVKKQFNSYTGQELFKLLRNAKQVKADFIKSANKKL
ncbi:MAG: hypothetical protein EAZ35_02335 [Sphingobacteriia bacterium]|nr:MAG: hypothetical protein EAZ35_02335 [Sphingobacteriia bacterium]